MVGRLAILSSDKEEDVLVTVSCAQLPAELDNREALQYDHIEQCDYNRVERC